MTWRQCSQHMFEFTTFCLVRKRLLNIKTSVFPSISCLDFHVVFFLFFKDSLYLFFCLFVEPQVHSSHSLASPRATHFHRFTSWSHTTYLSAAFLQTLLRVDQSWPLHVKCWRECATFDRLSKTVRHLLREYDWAEGIASLKITGNSLRSD